MQKFVRLISLAVVIVVVAVQPSYAVTSSSTLSDAQSLTIQQNCKSMILILNELEKNDALVYVNLGQHYDNISRRLMSALNSRIALNGMDGIELAQTTIAYNKAYQEYGVAYNTYDTGLQAALSTDCQSNPVQFYGYIYQARADRKALAKVVTELYKLGVQYQTQLKTFEKKMTESNQ